MTGFKKIIQLIDVIKKKKKEWNNNNEQFFKFNNIK